MKTKEWLDHIKNCQQCNDADKNEDLPMCKEGHSIFIDMQLGIGTKV